MHNEGGPALDTWGPNPINGPDIELRLKDLCLVMIKVLGFLINLRWQASEDHARLFLANIFPGKLSTALTCSPSRQLQWFVSRE